MFARIARQTIRNLVPYSSLPQRVNDLCWGYNRRRAEMRVEPTAPSRPEEANPPSAPPKTTKFKS